MALTAGYPGNTGEPYEFGGAPLTTGISDPAPAQVYQTVRHTDHSYTFADVPDGKYTVRIHFTDAYAEGRAMNYTIEGRAVLTGFNIADAAGGSNRVVVEEFDVTVSDGNGLQIVCGQGSGNDVFEAAIEVLSAASAVTTAGRRGASRRSCHGISLTADGRLVIHETETVRRLVLVDLSGAVVAATEPRGRRIVPLPGACVSGMYAARLVTDQGTRSYRLVVP